MALITCPECRAQVSDKATMCIRCGYPIQKNSTIMINTTVKNPPPCGVQRCKVTVTSCDTGEVLWKGKVGDIITLDCTSDSMNVEILIHAFLRIVQTDLSDVNIRAGKKYQIINTPGLFSPTHFSLAETDMI